MARREATKKMTDHERNMAARTREAERRAEAAKSQSDRVGEIITRKSPSGPRRAIEPIPDRDVPIVHVVEQPSEALADFRRELRERSRQANRSRVS
jgi:hypothetical protein